MDRVNKTAHSLGRLMAFLKLLTSNSSAMTAGKTKDAVSIFSALSENKQQTVNVSVL